MATNDPIQKLADATMRAVARSGVIRCTRGADDNVDLAVRVMRQELKALVVPTEDDDGYYADARQAVLNGSVNERYVVGLVALRCVERIQAEG